MAGSQALCLYFLIPVSKVWIIVVTPVALLKVTESKHGCHVFLAAVIMAGDPDEIAGAAVLVPKAEQDDIPEIIIAMEQKAVVSVHPAFPGQAADILGTDR